MEYSLQAICNEFIENRRILKNVFKAQPDAVYPMCANLYCAHNVPADEQKLLYCKQLVKEDSKKHKRFRGNMYALVSCILALSEAPEEKLRLAEEYYHLLKQYFTSCDQLVFCSFMLTDLAEPGKVRESIERGHKLYQYVHQTHPALISEDDGVLAVLMAFSEKSNDELIEDVESCYRVLKTMAQGKNVRNASLILGLSDRESKEKSEAFIELFNVLKENGLNITKNYMLSVLASIAILAIDPEMVAKEIADVDKFLSKQKGYKGLFGTDKKARLLHSTLLVCTANSPGIIPDVVSVKSMLPLLAVQVIMMISCTMSTLSQDPPKEDK